MNWLKEPVSTSERKGSTPDDLIPFGEYGNIGSDDVDVQLKITEIIVGEDAVKILGRDLVIIKMNIKAIDLNGEKFSPGFLKAQLKNGVLDSHIITTNMDEQLELPHLYSFTFAEPGEIDCFILFDFDLEECKYLVHENWGDDGVQYFSLEH